VVELAQRLAVSGETVRRDLQALADDGIVQKFHGGVSLHRDVQESPFQLRLRSNVAAKRRLAQQLSALLPNGASLVLDNSSTACFVAEALAERRGLTVATPSLEVARALAQSGDRHTVMMPGGTLRSSDMTLAGANALRFAAQLHPDFLVVSVAALSAGGGCLDFDPFEVEFKQAVQPQAGQVIVLADSSKFEAPGLITSLPWRQVQVLVTDQPLPPELEAATASVRVVVAG
jgi:DeoR family glycerol-3-phosphate regulon repressor